MREYDIYKWAVKGLTAEIDKLEKDIQRGKQLLRKYENGNSPKTPKTPQEIRQIIQDKKDEIKKLDKQRFDLNWEISEME